MRLCHLAVVWSGCCALLVCLCAVVGAAGRNDGLCLCSVASITVLKKLLFNCSATIVSNTRGNLRTFFLSTSSFRCGGMVRKVASSDTLVNYMLNKTFSNVFTSHLKHHGSLELTTMLFFLSTLNSCCPRFLFFRCKGPGVSLLIAFGLCHILNNVNIKLTSTIYPVCVTRVTPSGVHKALISYGRFTVVFNVLIMCFIGCLVVNSRRGPVVLGSTTKILSIDSRSSV